MPYVYLLKCLDISVKDFYIGSTTSPFDRELDHKGHCRFYQRKVYDCISSNGGFENWEMILLCECDEEIQKDKEQEFIDLLKPTLNDRNAKGLDIERRRQTLKEYGKKRRQTEKYKQDKKIWDAKRNSKTFSCECGEVMKWSSKSKHLTSKRHLRKIPVPSLV
jgi:hypothetical protein